jgi:P-type Ca2+ transporter type 2C
MNMPHPITRSVVSSTPMHAGLTSAEAKRQLEKYRPHAMPEDASSSASLSRRKL